MKKFLQTFMFLMIAGMAFGQGSVSGKIIDADSKEALPGATVLVKGTSDGVATGYDGSFTIEVEAGSKLEVSYLGYSTVEVDAEDGMTVSLEADMNVLGEVVITSGVIDFAKVRETPVAVSTISPAEISLKVGNQEFPEIMNKTPGVYATKNGGGYGDSRISLRGFDQRNTSFLINGQPVNDMENGWVYWSNWAGLVDVASGIQIQRGLGASRLAVPSVGGTVSIFTKAAEARKGGAAQQVIGNDGFTRTSLSLSSGLNENGWAASVLLSRWAGNGYVYNTAGEGWTYFAAVGYAPENSNHSINLSVLGAGQWHHQRDVWVSIRDYQNFGENADDPTQIDRRWNTNGGTMTIDGETQEFSMRRNFYNKPLATFNWDWEITSKLKLATSLYGSAGRGGGTGPRGNNFRNSDINFYPFRKDLTEHQADLAEDGINNRDENGFINFDNVISVNQSTTEGYTGVNADYAGQKVGSNGFRDDNVNRAVMIRRASMNSHNWIGAISNLEYNTDAFKFSVGIDWRNYTGYHYRALNNLMGLDAYYSTGNDNTNGQFINTTIEASPFNNTGLNGPKINYYNIGVVKWLGYNGMIEYNNGGALTAVLQGGYSSQSFQRIDYFGQPANPESETQVQPGGYIKGGANYNIGDKSNVFFNAGHIIRQPNFDAVFPGFANDINPDLQNEKITSFELGYGYVSNNFKANVNLYTTTWGNRFFSRSVPIDTTTNGIAQFKDVESLHNGIEVEASWNPTSDLRIKGMLSLGNWTYTKDFFAEVYDDNQNFLPAESDTLYLSGVRVGDAAQSVAYIEADYKVTKNIRFDLGYRFVNNLYADFSVLDDTFDEPNNVGSLLLPSYGLLDAGLTFNFKISDIDARFRINANNVLDTEYIAESNTNVHTDDSTPDSEQWNGIHTSNFVWFGFGRTWNASFKINF
jgi:hypothetical protein